MDIKQEMIEIRKRLSKVLFNFAEISTSEGLVLVYDGDTLTEGMDVFTYDENGEKVVAPNGDYTIDGLGVITIEEGKVSKITPTETPASEVEVEQSKETETIVEKVEEKVEDPNKDILVRLEESEKNIKNILEILDKMFKTVDEFSKQSVDTKIEKVVIDEKEVRITNKGNKALKYFEK